MKRFARITHISALGLVLLAIAIHIRIVRNAFGILEPTDKISNIIQLWTAIATAISILYLVPTFVVTIHSFLESKRPFLLIQARDGKMKGTNNHATFIHQVNNSNNPFTDLTIQLRVKSQTSEVNLDHLFTPKMYFCNGDIRDLSFDTRAELTKKGFDLDAMILNGDVTLEISYEYTFHNRSEKVKVQRYKWDSNKWRILG